MKTANLIQAQANVIKITSLVQGDVVKILEKDYGDTFKTFYGVVTDLMNNGENQFITIAMYEKNYGGFITKIKTYSGNSELTIFPATIEEVQSHFTEALKSMQSSIETKRKELLEQESSLQIAKEFVNGETSKKLSECSFKEITQKEYNEQKQALLS